MGDSMEWQPIETAPKTGIAILLYGSTKIIYDKLNIVIGYWDEELFLDDVEPHWVFIIQPHSNFHSPTHWMPLPEPPTGATQMKSDISEAIQLLLSYNNSFAVRGDFQLIHMWLAEGCDLLKDIIPGMKEMMARNKNITSVAYFAPRIMRMRDNRLDMEKAKVSPCAPPQIEKIDPFTKAKLYAWKRAKKMYLNGPEEDYLKFYESQYGEIAL